MHNLIFVSAALLAIFLTVGVVQAAPAGKGQFIDVTNNKGGNVLEMVKRREQLARSGKTVRVRGFCRSACTILITMPNACLGPGATVGFHAPRIPNTSIIPPYVDQIMGHYYRNGIRSRWFGGWNKSLKMHVITSKEYVRLDPQSRICASLVRPQKKRK